jgi:urease accessory protein
MITSSKLIPQGRGLAAVLLKRAGSVVLDWDTRQKSRFEATDSGGRRLAVFLPRGKVVRGGDVLVVEDGSLVRVDAAPQPVMVVRHCPEHGTPFDLLRAAYHLGNRHVALELQADHLKLEPDHVLASMLRAMHLIVTDALAAFEPEAGAYAAAGHAADHGHRHEHEHPHDHGHEHGHDHGREHGDDHDPSHRAGHDHDHHPHAPARGKPLPVAVKAAPAPHVHGPGCGHEHHDGHGH